MITTIHDDVCPCRVASRITREIEIGALQFLSHTLPTHGNLIQPDILGLLGSKVTDLSGHIARRHGIDPGKLHPLDRQALAQMDHPRLGGIICRLQLGDVDDVSGHGGSGDEGAALEVFDLVLLFLLAPDGTAGASAVESAVQISIDYLMVVLELTVDHGALCPGDARVGYEDVETAVELGELGSDSFVDGLGVVHINLEGLA